MQVLKPPAELLYGSPEYHVFFAGSIEQDTAEDWQTRLTEMLTPLPGVILNPRRDTWDASWEQKFTNAQFKEQVEWELDAMDMADRIIMYFDLNTKSPVTLLELGLHANSKKLLVCCPEGFWRKGNVDVICNRYEIQQVNSLEDIRANIEYDLQLDDIVDSLCGKDNETERLESRE